MILNNGQEIKIYQIYYQSTQKDHLDSNFIPFFNTAGGYWHEYGVFKGEYDAGNISSTALTGYLSWKFKFKTHLTGEKVLSFIKENPGYDVYFFNPFFELEDLYKNVWLQGEIHHKGIIKMAESIYREAGYNFNLESEVHDVGNLLYCNYWVGSLKFWNEYMFFLKKIEKVITNSSSDLVADVYRKSGYHSNANYIPFILERSFSTFLFNNREIKTCPYRYSSAEKAEIILQLRSAAEREFEVSRSHIRKNPISILKQGIKNKVSKIKF